MPTTRLYSVALPEATQPSEEDSVGTQLTEQGVLGEDAIVEALSGQAADLTLTGKFAVGTYYSKLLAAELSELADATLSGLPLIGTTGSRAGYYEIANADVGPVHAGGRDIQEYTVSLTRIGTRNSQFQAVDATVTQPAPGTPFGTGESGLVGIPASARLVEAVDTASQPSQRSLPTPTSTVTTEFGDVDLYDVTSVPFADPVFVYDVTKDAQPRVDVSVYDTRGRGQKYIEGDNGRVRAWQRVFARSHEFDGAVVLSSGRLRLRLTEPTGGASAAISAEEYTGGSWSDVGLPNTGWAPVDVDLTALGMGRVEAQVTFSDGTDRYALDLVLDRGRSELGVWIPRTETQSVPSGLFNLLDPIAASSAVDPGVTQRLVPRSEVRR